MILESFRPLAARSSRPGRKATVAAASAAILLGVAACGQSGANEPAAERTIPGKPTTTKAPCDPVELATPALDKKPTVEKGTGEAPTTLVTEDITVGTGAEAKAGDALQMMYTGALFSDGTEFDSSWQDGRGPFEVSPLGQASVIDGWNEGLVGMKVGGRRKLIIPPDKGYGANGSPPKIPANATLIFVVDLIQLCPGSAPVTLPTVPGSTQITTAGSTPGTSAGASTSSTATTATTTAPATSSTAAGGGSSTTATTAAGSTTSAPA